MDKNKIYKQTIANYWRALRKHPRLLALALINPVGGILLSVGVPFFAGLSLASVITQDGSLDRNIVLLGLVSLGGVALNRIGFVALMKLQAQALKDLNNSIFEHVLRRGLRFHTNTIGGKLVSDMVDYMTSFATLLMASFTNGASFIVTVIFGLTVVLTQSVQLAGFLLIITIVTLIWAALDSRRRSRVRTVRHRTQKKMISHYSDTIVNAQTAKIFATEDRELVENKRLSEKLRQLRVKDWSKAGTTGNNRVAFLLLGIIGLILFLNYLTQNNPDNIGVGIFAFTYTFSLLLRLFEINTLTTQIEEALLNARPMTEILDQDYEIVDEPNAADLDVKKAEIRFQNVQFHYTDNDSPDVVFENLNLTIKPGEKVGVVGPSGGGKTTLTRLIQRFDDIQSGSILIDGQDIAQVTQNSLRRSIGYVPQEPLLFHRSIGENIGYGKDKPTQKEVEQAAKKAQADDFIKNLQDGYDTIVGERGVKLSGGQRQRVAIARAILKDAPLLVLDEATSALDSESEVMVQEALGELMKHKTTIVIAHRLSTIQKMDRIIVLDGGKIVEEGKHEELVKKKNGLYARLWSHQSGGFLQD